MILNPTHTETEGADLDLIVAGTKSDILMVEGEMKEVQEADMIEAIKVAHDAIKKHCIAMEELSAMVPKSQTKRTYNHENNMRSHRQEDHGLLLPEVLRLCHGTQRQGSAHG
jgi:polyribonucleotide nucleotidyltransferase